MNKYYLFVFDMDIFVEQIFGIIIYRIRYSFIFVRRFLVFVLKQSQQQQL